MLHSRELASILWRDAEFSADKYVFVVDRAQSRHFEFLKCLLNICGKEELANKIEHVSFGRVKGLSTRLKTRKFCSDLSCVFMLQLAMICRSIESTSKDNPEPLLRKGRTEAVDEIIQHGCHDAAKFVRNSQTIKIDESEIDDVAMNLSLSTVIVNDLKRSRTSEYVFTFKNAFRMNSQGNALLLQTKHSRLRSLEERNDDLLRELDNLSKTDDSSGPCGISSGIDNFDLELDLNSSAEADRLVAHLWKLDDALLNSLQKADACHLTVYLLKLANLTGSASASLRVLGEADHTRALSRLLLLSASRSVLSQGMQLIGVEPLKKM
ncbi:unnamed protein product [Anisakis simplex]|uniref:Probable arginine--tRNA ligase, mitochondrial n=1 Tax=Anisakis simplex TaxID=6269 RepID=A0A3P6N8K5_ANISI|nr:unnamed protein product [Anisakis simplex]